MSIRLAWIGVVLLRFWPFHVTYVGTDSNVLQVLEKVLGAPFA